MENILYFLLNEIPSHTQDMISALNISIEKINYARILLNDKSIKSQKQDKLDEAMEYMQANKELQKLENYLKEFVKDTQTDNTFIHSIEQISSEQFHDMEEVQIEEVEQIIEDEITDPKIDYRKYAVDNTIPYALSKDLENTTPHSFSFMGDRYPVSNYLQVWLKICEILYDKDKQIFENIATSHSISGKKKAYIVHKGDAIAKNNKKPMQFLDTDIVLETNTSTIQKVSIIQKLLNIYKIPKSAVKIYLENDRRPLHNQQPIGKYINQNNVPTKQITPKEPVNKEKPEIKIAQLAYDYFTRYFKDTSKVYNIQDFLNEEWCIENLGISCPLLKLIDPSKELKEQTIYGAKNYPSYAQNPKFLINGKYYIMCMRWFEVYRPKLEKWISEHEIIETNPPEKRRDKSNCIYYDFKKDLCESVENPLFNQPCTHALSCEYYIDQKIYILSKEEMKNKVCPHCGLSMENIMQEVTYTKNGNPDLAVTKKLIALRCNYCNRIFINDSTFKSYIANKNIEDINAKFVNFSR